MPVNQRDEQLNGMNIDSEECWFWKDQIIRRIDRFISGNFWADDFSPELIFSICFNYVHTRIFIRLILYKLPRVVCGHFHVFLQVSFLVGLKLFSNWWHFGRVKSVIFRSGVYSDFCSKDESVSVYIYNTYVYFWWGFGKVSSLIFRLQVIYFKPQ